MRGVFPPFAVVCAAICGVSAPAAAAVVVMDAPVAFDIEANLAARPVSLSSKHFVADVDAGVLAPYRAFLTRHTDPRQRDFFAGIGGRTVCLPRWNAPRQGRPAACTRASAANVARAEAAIRTAPSG